MEQTHDSKKIKHGFIHGRFQPPHNGHIRYIIAALEYSEFVTIGICTPQICTEEEAEKTGYPCTATLNPFTFQERVDMITLALEELEISKDRYTCIPFPSDYLGIAAILPKDTVFLMSVTGASDQRKIDFVQGLGYKVETLMNIHETDSRERSGIVRDAAKKHTTLWEEMVPKSVAVYLKNHDFFKNH